MSTCAGQPFTFYCQKVLPAVFDDTLSYYEQVCRLTDKINELVNADKSDLEELQEAFRELYEYVHGSPWEDAICKWVNDNLPCIVAQTCKWFHFGIDDSGHVVCTVPVTWQNLDISWDWDVDSPDFGRITIGWK